MRVDNRVILAQRRSNPLARFAQGVDAAQGLQANNLALMAGRQEQSQQTVQQIAQGVLSSPDPAGAYPVALRQASAMGFDVSRLPQEWGEDAQMAVSMAALPEAQLTDFQRRAQFMTPQELRQEALIASGIRPRAQPTDPLDGLRARRMSAEIQQLENPQPDFSDRQGLRKEFIGQTTVKDFRKQAEAFGRIDASAFEPSPAGDLALIFNYMKVLDPGSVVRESEFATAARSGSYGDRIQATVDQILAGTRLSEDQRADFVSRAQRLYADAERQYTAVRDQYARIAEDEGFEVDKTLPDYRYRSRAESSEALDLRSMTDAELEELLRTISE